MRVASRGDPGITKSPWVSIQKTGPMFCRGSSQGLPRSDFSFGNYLELLQSAEIMFCFKKNTYGDGSKPIILYLEGMNIHLPGNR